MGQQRLNQKKTAAPTIEQRSKTSVKSSVHPVEELQAAIGNREMGRLMETNHLPHPSASFPKLQGELPLLGDMMPVTQGTIQRQPLFRGLSQELTADTPMALPATGAVIQPKLTLGTPGDMYEQEADAVARQVVDKIHSSPFREQNTRSEEERKPEVGEAGRVQRQITVRASGDAGGELSSEWEGQLQRAKSGGQPLSPSVKEPMERAFGADFGGVRVHTGAQADGLARSIQAMAFTTGQDVFFQQGAYEPGSRGGQELIAHELTHVVQQKGSNAGQVTLQCQGRGDDLTNLLAVASAVTGLIPGRGGGRLAPIRTVSTALGLMSLAAGAIGEGFEDENARVARARDAMFFGGTLYKGTRHLSAFDYTRGIPFLGTIPGRANIAGGAFGLWGLYRDHFR